MLHPRQRNAPVGPTQKPSRLPVSLIDDEVPPGDVLQRPLLQVGHLIRRDELQTMPRGRHTSTFNRDGSAGRPAKQGVTMAKFRTPGQSGKTTITSEYNFYG